MLSCSAKDHRLGRLSVVRVARRRPRRQVLHRAAARTPACGGLRPLLRQLGADLGFVPLVIGVGRSSIVLDAARVGQRAAGRRRRLSILVAEPRALVAVRRERRRPGVRLRRWWTVLSATWLHGGLLHILFNMMWVRDLGPSTADVVGPARTVIIYVVSGVCGFLLSSVAGLVPAADSVLAGRSSRWARRRRSSGCSARSCTTGARAAAA